MDEQPAPFGKEPAGPKEPRQDAGVAWSPLARLAVFRNVLVACVLAGALIVVLYLVFAKPAADTPTTPTTPASPPGTSAGLMVNAAQSKLPPLPKPDNPAYELMEPPPKIMAKAKPPLMPTYDEDGVHYYIVDSNVAVVEQSENFVHDIVTMGEGQYMHTYTFKLGCGHTVMATPDEYRNVMYKYPEKVAAEYKKDMCESCQKLKDRLKSKKAK